MKYDLVIFDLDGTLLDTSKGIFNSVRHAEKNLKLNPISDEMLRAFVGPPPKDMYKKTYGLSEDEAAQATVFHRQYGMEKGQYESEVYPEMTDVLKTLKENGIKLAVATLKAEKIALSVLKYHGILDFFDAVVGMDENETRTKEQTINIAKDLTNCCNAVMVGDSLYDAIGAKKAAVDFVPVTYGYGFTSNDEIEANPYIMVADSPIQILKVII